MVDTSKLQVSVWRGIASLVNQFREKPYYFFTESDLHSYFWKTTYSGNWEIERGKKRFYLIHREYPTNFRFDKQKSLKEVCAESYIPENEKGSRGHYDIAVLNPEFVEQAGSSDAVINKSIKNAVSSLLFAMEFKYIIKNSKDFIRQVKSDNDKLLTALSKGQATEAVNLVFANDNYDCVKSIESIIETYDKRVKVILIKTEFKNTDKTNFKILTNYGEKKLSEIRSGF